MISITILQSKTANVTDLQNYLENNFEEVYDFFELQKHSELLASKEELRRYIALNRLVLSQLDKKNNTNLSYVALLLDACERLGLKAQFKQLYDFLANSNFNIGNRLEASALYLINTTKVDDYIDRYDTIYELLKSAYENEEDNKDKVLATVINYYSQVLIDFGQFNIDSVFLLRKKIEITISDNKNSFLNHGLIESVLGIDVTEFEIAHKNIHILLDSFIGRDIIQPRYATSYLLESDTDYAHRLQETALNFNSIREISVKKYNLISDNSVYYSLQRGVKVLTEESQLLAYMYSFGRMHFEKLNTSFEYLPKELFKKELNIIDWGCGQAMATMAYFDHIIHNSMDQNSNQITLIEPSELALKRGTLHVKKYLSSANIYTINKDLDSLSIQDFNHINKKYSSLHFFSNILDIDLFSLTDLIAKIDKSFKGVNYFVCMSPYINDIKTSRLDTFMKHFKNNQNYEEFAVLNNKAGEWKQGWTRVVRIFKATIS